jgi:hypothetical protein
MTIANCTPDFTRMAANKKKGLIQILSHAIVNGEYINVWIDSLSTLRSSAAAAGLTVCEKYGGNVVSVWNVEQDTLYGVWHRSDKTAKIYENGVRPYGN